MPKNYGANKIKILFTLIQIVIFVFIIVYADTFSRGNERISVNSSFVQMDDGSSESINLDSIATVELNDQNNGIIQYIVQGGDSLGKIASKFGTTISNIKKINNLGSNPIKPGVKLLISDNEDGILYTLTEKSNVLVFANKYGLNVEDILTLNNLQDDSELLQDGQEIFIPINQNRAYDIGLLERPEPIVIKPKPNLVNTKPKNNIVKKPNSIIVRNQDDKDPIDRPEPPKRVGKIKSQRVFNKKINNKFAPGYCTWYVASVMPKIFPYIDENTQDRPFGGNANQRLANAKSAGYKVGQTPRAGSIIVYGRGARLVSAGHVGVVDKYDSETGELIVRDMNYLGKYIVTVRSENKDNDNIIGYIYP